MPTFRKKPIVVEAEQFWPTSGSRSFSVDMRIVNGSHNEFTLPDGRTINPGDWLVTEPNGSTRIVAPDQFLEDFEPSSGVTPSIVLQHIELINLRVEHLERVVADLNRPITDAELSSIARALVKRLPAKVRP